jgi:hypothetical protein
MKTQLSKPARTNTRYTKEYKQEALELWRASGRSAAKVAAELGIRLPLLYRWAHLDRQPNASKSKSKSGRSVEELKRGEEGSNLHFNISDGIHCLRFLKDPPFWTTGARVDLPQAGSAQERVAIMPAFNSFWQRFQFLGVTTTQHDVVGDQ